MAEKGNSKSMIIYKIDGGPPSCALMMLCDILGLDYESKDLDFGNLEHKSAAYKKMSPMGTIPVLCDGDFIISESHSAMKYLLTKYGSEFEDKLYPSDLYTRALVDQFMFFDTGVLFIRVKEVALPTVFGGLKGPTKQNLESIEDGYGVLEAYLQNNKYIATDHLTLADLSLGATTNVLNGFHKLDEKKFPHTVDWLSRLNKEPCFKISLRGAKLITDLVKSFWDK